MATSKILFDGVGIDLTNDTVGTDTSNVVSGKTFHASDGTIKTGSLGGATFANVTTSTLTTAVPIVTTSGTTGTKNISGITIPSGKTLSISGSGKSQFGGIADIEITNTTESNLADISVPSGKIVGNISGAGRLKGGLSIANIESIDTDSNNVTVSEVSGTNSLTVTEAKTTININGKQITDSTGAIETANLAASSSGSSSISIGGSGISISDAGTGKGFNVAATGSGSVTPTIIASTSKSGFATKDVTSATAPLTVSASASINKEIPKVVGSVTFSNSAPVTPTVSRYAISISGVTDAASGSATTSTPTSGVYVKVKSLQSHKTLQGIPSVSSAGYGTASKHGLTSATTTVGADASADTYIPINVATTSKTDATASATATAGTASVVTNPSASASMTRTSNIGQTTVPSGTEGTDYWKFTSSAFSNSGVVTATGGTARASVTASNASVSAGYSSGISTSTSAQDTGTKTGSTVTTTAATASDSSSVYLKKAEFEASGRSIKTKTTGAGYIPGNVTVGSVAVGSASMSPNITSASGSVDTITFDGDHHYIVNGTIYAGLKTTASVTPGYISSISDATASKTLSNQTLCTLEQGTVSVSGSASVSGSGDVNAGTNTISKNANTNVASGSATTTKPGSGYYVAVDAQTAQGSGTVSVSGTGSAMVNVTEGYVETDTVTGSVSASGSASVTVPAKSASTTYIPITGAALSASGSVSVSGSGDVNPGTNTISKNSNTNVSTGTTTTTKPSSGYYVAVDAKTAQNTGSVAVSGTGTASAGVSTAGYAPASLTGSGSVSGSGSASVTVPAKSASTTYVPITSADISNVTTSTATTAMPLITAAGYTGTKNISAVSVPSGKKISVSGSLNEYNSGAIDGIDSYDYAATVGYISGRNESGSTGNYVVGRISAREADTVMVNTIGDSADGFVTGVNHTVGNVTIGDVGGALTINDMTTNGSVTIEGTQVADSSGVLSGSVTPTATKGTASSYQISVTPKATRTAGFISAGTSTGTAVTVAPSDLGLTAASNTSMSVNGKTVSLAAGYYTSSAISKAVADGAVSVPTSSGASTSTSLNGTTLTVSRSVSPSVTAGYVTSGSAGTVTITGTVPTQSKTVTSSFSQQTVTPDSGKLLSSVTINGLSTDNIEFDDGASIGTIRFKGNSVSKVWSYDSDTTISQLGDSAQSGNASISISDVQTNLTVEGVQVANSSGLITGSFKANNTTKKQSTPSISVSSTGLITASVAATSASVSSSATGSGVISSGATGSSGTVTMSSSSNTKQLTTKGATTITPSTSSQTAVASGVYTTGTITVAAMPSGSAGTPTASKGTASSYQLTVTPSVTNTTGYITGGTKTGTGVTVSATDLGLSAQAGKTVTPSTSEQTAVDAGKYTTGAVKVAAMPTGSIGQSGGNVENVSGVSISATNSSGLYVRGVCTVSVGAGYLSAQTPTYYSENRFVNGVTLAANSSKVFTVNDGSQTWNWVRDSSGNAWVY